MQLGEIGLLHRLATRDKKLWAFAGLLLLLIAALPDGLGKRAQAQAAGDLQGRAWRIAAFGDSITASSCYPQRLYAMLAQTPGLRFEFVGSRPARNCGVREFRGRHEGHNCYVISEITRPPGTGTRRGCNDGDTFVGDSRDLEAWFPTPAPDIVLWHIGTNDVWGKPPNPHRILDGYDAVLAALRAKNPNVMIFVAKILPLGSVPGAADGLNAAIPAWAHSRGRPESPIRVVDLNSGFDLAWTTDQVHPNENEGSLFMARRWYEAILPAMKGGR